MGLEGHEILREASRVHERQNEDFRYAWMTTVATPSKVPQRRKTKTGADQKSPFRISFENLAFMINLGYVWASFDIY